MQKDTISFIRIHIVAAQSVIFGVTAQMDAAARVRVDIIAGQHVTGTVQIDAAAHVRVDIVIDQRVVKAG